MVGQDVPGRFHEGGEILWREPQCSSRYGPGSGPPSKGPPCFQVRKDFGDVGKTESLEETGRERMRKGAAYVRDALGVCENSDLKK